MKYTLNNNIVIVFLMQKINPCNCTDIIYFILKLNSFILTKGQKGLRNNFKLILGKILMNGRS